MVKTHLIEIERRIQAACTRSGRQRSYVKIVAVTKTLPPEVVNEAIDTGLTEIGENRVQEYLGKREALHPHVFHMIGALQKNKVRHIIDTVALIHSVDSPGLAEEIDKRAMAVERIVPVLIEVNTSGEDSKHGVPPKQALEMVREMIALPHIAVKGFMTVAEYVADPEDVRESFRMLRQLKEDAVAEFPAAGITELSMGMTNDYEVAIEEGATLVRLGTALFGARMYNQ